MKITIDIDIYMTIIILLLHPHVHLHIQHNTSSRATITIQLGRARDSLARRATLWEQRDSPEGESWERKLLVLTRHWDMPCCVCAVRLT